MKVLEIPDRYSVIVDYGLNDGAAVGDTLRIYKKGLPVRNANGTIIGTLDEVKEEVKVTVPYENFSICQKEKKISIPALTPLADILASVSSHTQVELEELNVDVSEISNRVIPTPSPVQVGDKVMLLRKAK